MAEYLLRPLTAAELPALAALERACFSPPWTERQLAADTVWARIPQDLSGSQLFGA